MQMTQATFDTWVKNTRLVSRDDDILVIGAESVFAKDWLENRLFSTIQRTASNLLDRPVEIHFVVDIPVDSDNGRDHRPANAPATKREEPAAAAGVASPETEEPPAPPEPGVEFANKTNFYSPKIEMGRWLAELQYDHHFWQPYLGLDEYLCYRKLLSIWTNTIQKKAEVRRLLDPSKTANQAWTRPFRISYRHLTRLLGKSNPKYIPGGLYECHRSDQARRLLDQPLQECCDAHQPRKWCALEDDEKGGGHCFYWRPGLLHRLFDEHLLAIEISSSNRATVQVWRALPLLTPAQVGQMDELLQEDHERFIERYGSLFGELTLPEWATFTIESMAPHQPGYVESRECCGRPPQNPLVSQAQ